MEHKHFCWPVVPGVHTQEFGENPEYYQRFHVPGHTGMDIGCPIGSDVLSLADGVVSWIGIDRDYGNYVRIHHPQWEVYSFYAHLYQARVHQYDKVFEGQIIAISGNTGNTTGPHLHFEIRMADKQGDYVNSPYGRGRMDPEVFVHHLMETVT